MVISRVPESQRGTQKTSSAVALLLVLAVAVGVWLINGRDPGTATSGSDGSNAPIGTGERGTPGTSEPGAARGSRSADVPDTDPVSGLPVVVPGDLPPEAADTIDLIDSGPPYPYDQDGGTFGNFEGLLPARDRGYYQEFTVETPGSRDRGARRIIAGAGGELYWTDDHYASFSAIYR